MAAVQRKIDGILTVIEDGFYQLSMKQRLAELEREKAALTRQLAAPPERSVVRVRPNLAEAYCRRVSASWRAF